MQLDNVLLDRMRTCLSREVAVIGGGRWARQVAGALVNLEPPIKRLVLCSPRNPAGWIEWLKARRSQPRFADAVSYEIVSNLDDIANDASISHVAVIRAAQDNATTTVAMLRSGKSVYVEKPFAVTQSEASAVARAAEGRVCIIGLVFRFASYIRFFANAVAVFGSPEKIEVKWDDPPCEFRYGEFKGYNVGVNVAVDVLPHAISLIRMLVPTGSIELFDVKPLHGGSSISLDLNIGATKVQIRMARNAPTRRRFLEVRCGTRQATIDFSQEPGTAKIDDIPLDVSASFTSPLMQILKHFLGMTPEKCVSDPCGVTEGAAVVALSAAVAEKVVRHQVTEIAAGLTSAKGCRGSCDYALRELLATVNNYAARDAANIADIRAAAEAWLIGKEVAAAPPQNLINSPVFREIRSRILSGGLR